MADKVKRMAINDLQAEMATAKVDISAAEATIALLELAGTEAASFTFTPAPGAANVCEVTIQAKKADGTDIDKPVLALIYLSDAATGLGLTAVTASGAVAAKAASGTDINALTAKKAILVQTLANGSYVLSITDTAKTAFYVGAYAALGKRPSVSAVLATANYGT